MENTDEIWFKGLLEMEYVADKRVNSDGKVEYFVKWKENGDEENTWEPADVISDNELIEKYENSLLDKIVEKNKKLSCEICEKSFNSEIQAKDHFEGKSHIKKVTPEKLKRAYPSSELPPSKKAKTTLGNF